MAKGKLILICQSGGEFVTKDVGTMAYNGGEANAANVTSETPFNYLKLSLAETCDLNQETVTVKYFLPGNKRNLITVKNDKDVKRMIDFHGDAITAEVFVMGTQGFDRSAQEMETDSAYILHMKKFFGGIRVYVLEQGVVAVILKKKETYEDYDLKGVIKSLNKEVLKGWREGKYVKIPSPLYLVEIPPLPFILGEFLDLNLNPNKNRKQKKVMGHGEDHMYHLYRWVATKKLPKEEMEKLEEELDNDEYSESLETEEDKNAWLELLKEESQRNSSN